MIIETNSASETLALGEKLGKARSLARFIH